MISRHFTRSEFACNCGCNQQAVDAELLGVLERLRTHVNSPITLTSANRCQKWNRQEGGARFSKHLYGIAVDMQVQGYTPEDIYEILDTWYPNTYGLKAYKTWVHFDVRTRKWRG